MDAPKNENTSKQTARKNESMSLFPRISDNLVFVLHILLDIALKCQLCIFDISPRHSRNKEEKTFKQPAFYLQTAEILLFG